MKSRGHRCEEYSNLYTAAYFIKGNKNNKNMFYYLMIDTNVILINLNN